MKNPRFTIRNYTRHYLDYEIFERILECLKKGLISKNKTQYCRYMMWVENSWDLIFESKKTNAGYIFDVYEVKKGTWSKWRNIKIIGDDK